LLEFSPDQEIEIDNNKLDFKKPAQDSRMMSLNPAAGMLKTPKLLDIDGGKDKPSMRTMSLANRPDTDPMELVERAAKLCKNPIKLSWQNVFYEVDVLTSEEEREKNPAIGNIKRQAIVKSVNGFAPPGQATFIMGASGAGKTSLLNILCDRVSTKGNVKLSGNILFNDQIPVNKEMFARYGGYVQQDDVLFSHFTVREALTFAARLKLKIPDDEQD
jgi:ABC-type multidrug transport system fused ATPase/permease subunit